MQHCKRQGYHQRYLQQQHQQLLHSNTPLPTHTTHTARHPHTPPPFFNKTRAMSSRKRRANGRLTQQQQDEERSPGLDVEILEEQRTLEDDEDPRPSRKRRSTSAGAAAAGGGGNRRSRGGAAAAGDGDADDDPAAAAAGGGGGGDAAPEPPRLRRQRTLFSHEEADAMMDKIKVLEDEAEEARDRAADIDITSQALQTAVSRVVRFLLFKHHEKPGVPVKRQDILDNITAAACVDRSSRAAKKLPGVVLPLVAVQLAKSFGLELRELKRITAGQGGAAAGGGGGGGGSAGAGGGALAAAAVAGAQTYKLMSLLPTDLLTRYAQQEQDNQERGFMTIVLALLQLKQYSMDADELWRHLGQFGLEVGDEEAGAPFGGRHPTEILTAMEQTRYLISTKQPAPNTERRTLTVYEWGEAAYDEFGSGALAGIVDQWLAVEEGGGVDG